jgi:hypothetical protein
MKGQDAYMADDHGCLRVHRLYVILSVYETGELGCVRMVDVRFFLCGGIFLINKIIKYKK